MENKSFAQIQFEGKYYPYRLTEVEGARIAVSTEELGNALFTPDGKFKEGAEGVDLMISCYVPEHALHSMSDDEFAKFVFECCYA